MHVIIIVIIIYRNSYIVYLIHFVYLEYLQASHILDIISARKPTINVTAYRHYTKRQCIVRSWNICIRVGIGGHFVHVLTAWLWFHLHPPPLVIYTPSPAKFVFVFCFVRLYFLACTFFLVSQANLY